jgi:hypothetical protein
MTAPLHGLFGRPYLPLEHLLSAGDLERMDDEVTRGLVEVETTYTGGTLKWMGVVAPWIMDDGYADAMTTIEGLPDDELAQFLALAEDPGAFDLAQRATLTFGDETDHPFTPAQLRWLSRRHGVYFPWKVCYHLLDNDLWEDKHSGAGKDYSDEAKQIFPETVRMLRSLPFTEVGRVVIFGIEANDHAPLHRDTEPGKSLTVAQSISIDPRGNKRFYLCNGEGDEPVVVDSRMYWFNDMDYHGVLPDPFFRYSIRTDGVFDRSFLRGLERATLGR